jgi:hypothetical protein
MLQKNNLLLPHLLLCYPGIYLLSLAYDCSPLCTWRTGSFITRLPLFSSALLERYRLISPISFSLYLRDLSLLMRNHIPNCIYLREDYIGQSSKIVIIESEYREFYQDLVAKEVIWFLTLIPSSFEELLKHLAHMLRLLFNVGCCLNSFN